MTKNLNTAAADLRAAQLKYAKAAGPAIQAALKAIDNADYLASVTAAAAALDEGSPARAAVEAVGASVTAQSASLRLHIEQNERLIAQSESPAA